MAMPLRDSPLCLCQAHIFGTLGHNLIAIIQSIDNFYRLSIACASLHRTSLIAMSASNIYEVYSLALDDSCNRDGLHILTLSALEIHIGKTARNQAADILDIKINRHISFGNR